MKKYFLLFVIAIFAMTSCIKDRVTTPTQQNNSVNTTGDTLLYYWNCNTDTNHVLVPTKSAISGASLTYFGAYYDTAQPGTPIGAQGLDTTISGGSLRLRNPASGPFTLSLPTTGYKNIVVKYAVERTSKGAQNNTVIYSTDGTNFSTGMLSSQNPTYSVDTVFSLVQFDFSSDASVNNNPDFKIQINFSNGSTNTSGNDRFDNITVWGQKQ